MPHASCLTRRTLIGAGLTAGLLSGCIWRREVPPVKFGEQTTPKDAPIMAALSNSTAHRVLTDALRRTGLDALLSGNGPFTLFAPTDAAFDAMRPFSDQARLREDADFLKQVLEGHIFRARLDSEELLRAIPRLEGRTRVIALNETALVFLGNEPGNLRWQDMRNRTGRITVTDAISENGFIHLTDNVILPPAEKPGSE